MKLLLKPNGESLKNTNLDTNLQIGLYIDVLGMFFIDKASML